MKTIVNEVVGDRANAPSVMKVRNLIELKKKLHQKIIETGEKLGFRKSKEKDGYTAVEYDYSSFSKVAQKNKNQSLLDEHMKSLWLYNHLEDEWSPEKSACTNFDSLFLEVFPSGTMPFKKEKSFFNKKLEVDKKFKWLQKTSFWAVFTNNPWAWNQNFAFYPQLDNVKNRLPEAQKIFTLFSEVFKETEGFESYLTTMESSFKKCTGETEAPFDWKEELKNTTVQLEEADSPSFDQMLRLAHNNMKLGENEKFFKLWDLILKNLEENPNDIKQMPSFT
jgi:hypothetical protein